MSKVAIIGSGSWGVALAIHLAKLGNDKEKINYIFGIPIEISHYIIQEAICMNERDYKKYCDYRFMMDLESKGE